jgi:[ribosomal protein S5]-alanine N-acetyltransferase
VLGRLLDRNDRHSPLAALPNESLLDNLPGAPLQSIHGPRQLTASEAWGTLHARWVAPRVLQAVDLRPDWRYSSGMNLSTSRLLLREFEGSDLVRPLPPAISADHPPLQSWDFRDPDGVHRQIRAAIESAKDEPRSCFDLAVVRQDTGQLIGRAGAQKSAAEPREAMVWFASDPTSWNLGYLTEGAQALLSLCFKELKLHRVWAECNPENAGAVKVMETLGLRREGRLVENVWTKQGWQDTAIYALLDREWR